MTDPFLNAHPSLSGPASSAFAITPGDTATLAAPTRGLYVGGGGDLRVKMMAGESVTFIGVAGGSVLPVRVLGVLATGTTATAILGLA